MALSKETARLLVTGALLALTLLCVGFSAFQLSSQTPRYTIELLSYAILIAFTIALSIPISHSQLSLAHAGGMLAFLSLPAFVAPATTIAVFFGSLMGSVVVIWRGWQGEERVMNRASAYTGIFIIAGVTLSFFVSSHLYTDILQANLPLKTVLLSEIASQSLVLLSYVFIHSVVYVAIFTLQLYTEATNMREVVTEDLGKLAIIVLLPLPFAIVGANIARRDESVVLYGMTLTAAALIVFGLYAINGSERRWRRQAQELSVLSLATQSMRGSLDLESLIRIAYVQVSELLGANNVTIALWLDPSKPILYPLVVRNGIELSSEQKIGLPDDHALTRHVILNQVSLLMKQNISQQAHALGLLPPVPNTPNSWLGVPLVANEAPIGAIVVQSYNERVFIEADLRLLNILAASAGIAIDNARLYTQKSKRAEQLAVLNQVTRLLTETLSPNEVIDTIVSSAGTIFSANAVAVYVKPQGSGGLQLIKQSGFTERFNQAMPMPIERPKDVQSQTLLIEDVRLDPRANEQRNLLLSEGKQAFIQVPLVLGGYQIGVLMLYYDDVQSDLNEQLDVIQAFGTQVSQAINNARTFENADKALSATLDQLKAILNAMEEALVLFDANHQIVMANPRIKLVGLNVSQLIGKPVQRLLDEDETQFASRLGFKNNEAFLQLLDEAASGNWTAHAPQPYEIEGENSTTNFIKRQSIVIRDSDGAFLGVLMVFYDKTEEHELEISRESFTQMIVHDLRSPLTAVTTSLRLLSELVPKDADFRVVVDRTTDISRRALRKVLERVDAMLDIAKLESGEMMLEREPISVGRMIDNVIIELSPLAEELNIQIVDDLETSLPLLDVDGDKVERVILNLVDNALKYAPSYSQITVRVRNHGVGFVRLDVIDRGVGIPEEYRQRLFDRYVQVKGRQIVRRGVGLGLNFCRLVSEAHRGSIWIEENPLGGSVFSITLPTFTEPPP